MLCENEQFEPSVLLGPYQIGILLRTCLLRVLFNENKNKDTQLLTSLLRLTKQSSIPSFKSQAPVTHACSPSYSGGRDQEDPGSKPGGIEFELKALHLQSRCSTS
jgi:hypothetical protein